MTHNFHVNPSSGIINRCRAENGNCPFGGVSGEENHFDSIRDARAGYEAMMAKESVPRGEEKSRGLKTLNDEVKNSNDPAIFKEALEKGSERTLANLATNPNVPAEVLTAALAKAESEQTRGRLLFHENFPIESLSPDGFKELVSIDKQPWSPRLKKMWESDNLTDSHIDAVGGQVDVIAAIRNDNNKLSKEKIVEISESSSMIIGRALKYNRYPLEERAAHLDLKNLRSVGVQMSLKERDDPAGMEALANRAAKDGDSWVMGEVARNATINDKTLGMIVDSISEDDARFQEGTSALLSVYRNSNATSTTRKKAMSLSPTVSSFDKLSKLDEAHNKELGKLIGSGSETRDPGGHSSQSRYVHFDPKKVKELGLTSGDIDTYVRHYRGNWLFGASYDKSSGTYKGYID